MKKLICILLVFTLIGCSSKQNTQEEIKEEQKQTTEETVQEEAKETTETSSESQQEQAPASTANTTNTTTPAVTGSGVTLCNTSNTVIIDAGHGGSDPGASYGSNIEKNITLTYALAIGNYLSSKGINVIYTRTGDYELARSSYTYNGTT